MLLLYGLQHCYQFETWYVDILANHVLFLFVYFNDTCIAHIILVSAWNDSKTTAVLVMLNMIIQSYPG